MPFDYYPQRNAQKQVAIIGFPWDFGASLGRPGARYGPEAIRNAARWNLNRIRDDKIWDVEGGALVDLSEVSIRDYGDIPIAAHDRAQTFAAAEQSVSQALADGAFPVVFGGDHSISYPPIAALARATDGPLGIIQIDAHLDLVDDSPVQGRFSQSSQIRRALELPNVSPQRLVQIGLRGLNYPEYFAFCREQGIHQVTAPQVRQGDPRTIAEEALAIAGRDGAKIYLTFDIDALDPSVAPGAGALEFGGLTVEAVSMMLRVMAPHIAAFDIAELNPLFDVKGMTEAVAVKLLFDLLLARFGA